MTTAKRNFNYNMMNKTIEGTKKAIESANKGIEPYYSELAAMMNEHPNFNVVVKQRNGKVNSATGKNTYEGLTIEKMEAYILIFCGEDELQKFKSICEVGNALGKKYIQARSWFLNNHKDLLTMVPTDEIAKKYAEYVTKKENAKIIEMNTDTKNEKEVA